MLTASNGSNGSPISQLHNASHIRFDGRPSYRSRVFVRAAQSMTVDDIFTIFSKVSLLHQVHELPSKDDNEALFVIAFYAPVFAHQACEIFNGVKVKGFEMQVWRMKRQRNASQYNDSGIWALDNRESIEVLNHFLGFSGWSSCILGLKIKTTQKLVGNKKVFESCCWCRVQVQVRVPSLGTEDPQDSNVVVTVVGETTETNDRQFSSIGEAVQRAQKVAVTNARKNALQEGLEIILQFVLVTIDMATAAIFVLLSSDEMVLFNVRPTVDGGTIVIPQVRVSSP